MSSNATNRPAITLRARRFYMSSSDLDEGNIPTGLNADDLNDIHNEDLMLAICGDNRNAASIPLSDAAAAVDEHVRQGGSLTENGVEHERGEVIAQAKNHIAHCAIAPAFGQHDFDEDGPFVVSVMDDGLVVPFRKDGGLWSEYSESDGATVEKIAEDAVCLYDNRAVIESP